MIARSLGGHRAGRGWVARCPAHDDRKPSLSIGEGRDGTVLIHCHAGCDQQRVLRALREAGYWDAAGHLRNRSPTSVTPAPGDDDGAKARAALALWDSSLPTAGTLVEVYLASRRLRLHVPERLRFHPALKHPSGGTWPAMVGLISRGTDDTAMAIHRTYLARDGRGKAPLSPQKMMLGPCRGGAVRLADASDCLMVGEGIETCLAAAQASSRPVWAALSTSGLRTLDLPPSVGDVIVLADADPPGEAAARDCAGRWVREGRRVRIARPPTGSDFNDVLMAGAQREGGPDVR